MSDALSIAIDPPLDAVLSRSLIEIWVAVSAAGGAVGFVPPVTADDVRPVAQAAFDRVREGRDHLAVATVGEKPIGFGFLSRRDLAIFEHVGVVQRLQVHPAHQGGGVGGHLLEALADRAREDGLELLSLTVRGGTGRERFYERHGFVVVASVPGLIRVGPDDVRDELHLLRRLR